MASLHAKEKSVGAHSSVVLILIAPLIAPEGSLWRPHEKLIGRSPFHEVLSSKREAFRQDDRALCDNPGVYLPTSSISGINADEDNDMEHELRSCFSSYCWRWESGSLGLRHETIYRIFGSLQFRIRRVSYPSQRSLSNANIFIR